MNSITNNLKRASVDMILLSLLCEEDMYGYQISQEIKKRSNNELSLMQGSIYTILCRLSDKGYVTYEKIKVGKKLKRVYYHITDDGRVHLKEMIQNYHHMLAVISNLILDLEEKEKKNK